MRRGIRAMGRVHRVVYRATGGRVGGRIWGLSILLLTTTGRKTGKVRTTPLCFYPDGENLVVVASNGGLAWFPSWWLNLLEHPQAAVRVGRATRAVVARPATADERDTALGGDHGDRARLSRVRAESSAPDSARDPSAGGCRIASDSMLELRPNCELCDKDLPPDAADARICTYECTFCAACVEDVLHDVCPNCGGGFQPRPIRPAQAWRESTGLVNDPSGTRRRHTAYTREEIEAFAETLRAIPPGER